MSLFKPIANRKLSDVELNVVNMSALRPNSFPNFNQTCCFLNRTMWFCLQTSVSWIRALTRIHTARVFSEGPFLQKAMRDNFSKILTSNEGKTFLQKVMWTNFLLSEGSAVLNSEEVKLIKAAVRRYNKNL